MEHNVKDVIEILNIFFSGLLSLCSIILIIAGSKKLIKLIDLYRERHFEAVYGFYSNLRIYCDEFKRTLDINKGYWKKLDSKQQKSPLDHKYEELLEEISNNMIDFFKSEKNQVSPEKNYEKWEEEIGKLQDRLLNLSYIRKIELVSPTYEIFQKDLIKNLNYFVGNGENENGAIADAKLEIRRKISRKKNKF
ncbi:MAG: hypothetical protein FWD47_12335 [Treponema sp.]|nr:hypothetical protein [Treponema sp.]